MWHDYIYLILDRIRITIHVLKKSDFCRNPNTEEGGILTNLKELQSKLRSADVNGAIDLFTIVLPFTQILKSANFAGPFKLSALETFQIFMKSNLFQHTRTTTQKELSSSSFSLEDDGHVLSSAISEMVEVVATCKFIQTDNHGDELVQLQLLKTLYFTVLYIPNFVLLESCWKAFHFFLKTLSSTAGIRVSATRQLLAQEAIQHCLRFMLPELPSSNLTTEQREILEDNFREFLLQVGTVLRKYTVASVKKNSQDLTNPNNRPTTPVNTSAGGGGSGGINPNTEDQSILVFYLNLLQSIWVTAQSDDELCAYFLCNHKISDVFHNEIFFCLINIASQWEQLPIRTLQAVLSVFTTLMTTCAGLIRHVVEHFIRQVYLKALLKYVEILNYQIGATHPLKELLSSTASAANSPSPENTVAANTSPKENIGNNMQLPPYLISRTEVLEMIFESFTDLICDDALLPSLFASFDCHPLALDIVQPLIQLITRTTSIILTTGTEKLGSAKDLGIYIVQCYKQLLHTFSRRKVRSEKWYDEHQKKTAAANSLTPGAIAQLNELFSLARISKRLFIESSEKFLEKPTSCFIFLQEEGLLPSPLTPAVAAIFLRQNTFLDKTAVGAFLGELGKSEPKHECESKEFHQQLLIAYVESFELSGLTVLSGLRLFLSAFRLPGEAQQIDRILVAFSEYSHEFCLENQQNLIENPEITYLLSFSIIMLNTDRHNPNIRPEKKMTIEQFVKNNANYGKDCHQTKPLPKEYLEEIYQSIDKHPIRTTHGNDPFALVTDEEWMDLNMMLQANPYLSLLINTRQHPLLVNRLLSKSARSQSKEFASNDRYDENDSTNDNAIARYSLLKDLFTSHLGWYSSLHLSSLFPSISHLDWLWDRDLLYSTSPYLLLPGISVLIYNNIIVEETIYLEQSPEVQLTESHQLFEWKERTGRLMDLSTDFLMEILSIASKHSLWKMIDMVIAILLQVSGIKETDIAQTYVKMLSLPNDYLFPSTTSGMIIESDPLHEGDVYPDHCYFLQRISYGTVQKSLLLLLNITSTYYASVSNWSLVLYPLVILRDFTLLPTDLVFLDAEQDNLLPSNIRQEFEFALVSLDRQEQQQEALLQAEQQNAANTQSENTRSSFYALQFLGEALFGSSSNGGEQGKGRYGDDEEDDSLEGELVRIISEQYNVRTSRWDSGYEVPASSVSSKTKPPVLLGQRLLHHHNISKAATPRANISPDQNPFAKTVKWDVSTLRSSIEKTNIPSIIAESKFLPEEHLTSLLNTIIHITESYCSIEVPSNLPNNNSTKDSAMSDFVDHLPYDYPSHHHSIALNPAYANILPFTTNSQNTSEGASAAAGNKAYPIHYYRNSEHFLDTMHFISSQRIQSYISASSIAWLEMILVEISLRNRDRFHLCWPFLKYHYSKCLGNHFSKLSYITERQLSGLLKVSARMLSRDNYGGVLIELLGKIFHPLFRLPPLALTVANATAAVTSNTNPPSNTILGKGQPVKYDYKSASMELDDDEPIQSSLSASGLHTSFLIAMDSLQGLSNQIAAGMWKLFTHNVDLLPLLSLEQWETLFKIVAFGSNSGSFAAFKSFEVMAWLLHEPRLIANVPVFCIIAVKPLVYNKQAPIFVSTGAVKLLKYLHSRLEAIIQDPNKSDENDKNDGSNNNSAVANRRESHDVDYEELLLLDEASSVVWKKCWLPILHALAEGVADDRVPVREACAIALCEAINDRHSYAVPAGILIDVLVHILSPVIRVLGDYLISDMNKQSLHAAIASSTPLEGIAVSAGGSTIITSAPPTGGLPPSGRRGAHQVNKNPSSVTVEQLSEQDWIAVDPSPRPASKNSTAEEEIAPEITSSVPSNTNATTASITVNIESHVIMRCVDTLTTVFIKHVRKLSQYPSFDKLWLQLLQLFTHFLEITPPNSTFSPPKHPPSGAITATSSPPPTPSQTPQSGGEEWIFIQQLSNLCLQKLELLIDCLQKEKVFTKKDGLWFVTKDFLLQLSLPTNTTTTTPPTNNNNNNNNHQNTTTNNNNSNASNASTPNILHLIQQQQQQDHPPY